jgi:hypothetical protein
MVKWTLKILGPTCVGRLMWRNSVITESSLKWLKKDLTTCGLMLESLSDLPKRVHELQGLTLEVNKRTKGENETVYLDRRIVIDGPAPADSSALSAF